ncbi:MAG: gliding motility-associated C-terminal domain-containing protein [Candidatus Latescibacterota bacterium]|nr:gliding motility-associated C-terminal domain-containing protein [Candidatus Latescibacterota bacterium]
MKQKLICYVAVLPGVLIFSAIGEAQVQHLVIGQGGLPWVETSDDMLGLDANGVEGSLQPFELDPSVNIAVGEGTEAGQFTNIFGLIWELSGNHPPSVRDQTPWVYGARGRLLTVDGDVEQAVDIEGVSDYSFNLGFPMPLNRVVFFPPEKGRTTTRVFEGSAGLLIKDQYPRQYVVSGSLNEQDFLFVPRAKDFDNVLGQNLNQSERVADVGFATQFLQFVRVRFPTHGFIAEVQFFGEGFLPETRFVSHLIDMGEPVNFGRLLFDLERYRSPGFGQNPVLEDGAPVNIDVEVRSGRDDTPLSHHIYTDIGGEIEVTEQQYNRAPPTMVLFTEFRQFGGGLNIIAGQQASIKDDLTNWSFWSAPHTSSGEAIQAPDARQFVQVRAFITSEEVFTFGRLNSLSIEFSPLLANSVVGEVARMEEPQPIDGVVEVPLDEPVTLTYDVRAKFSSANQSGFDAIRLKTPEAVEFQRFEMGEQMDVVEPDSLAVKDDELIVHFSSHPVAPGSNPPLRFTFSTRVFNFNTVFEGEVFQIGGENLPQSIDGGDASTLVSTNDLQVFALLEKLEVLSGVDLGAGVLTPNGDGVNDSLTLTFTLQAVTTAAVEVGIYDLTGRLVHELVADNRGQGRYTEVWDGSETEGLALPGIYLVRVAVDTDRGTFEQMRTVAVVY